MLTAPMGFLQFLLIGAHLVAFPSVLLFLAAGAVFGLALGAVLTWIGTSIGQLLAFCVGRSASSPPIEFIFMHSVHLAANAADHLPAGHEIKCCEAVCIGDSSSCAWFMQIPAEGLRH